MSTPSSPTKRRLVSKTDPNEVSEAGSTTPPQYPKPGKRRKMPSVDYHSNGAPQIMSEDEINQIIASLSLPDPNTQVAVQYSNSISDTEVQAYAKLAGNVWTYYVQNIEVVIGRTSDPNSPQERVDIDLGPAKVVSRRHAVIQYNTKLRHWEIHILGRNGVRVDRVHYKEGSVVLRSGNILDIGGVQMMFVLPDEPPRIAFNPAIKNGHHKAHSSVSSVSPHRRGDEVGSDTQYLPQQTQQAPTPQPETQFSQYQPPQQQQQQQPIPEQATVPGVEGNNSSNAVSYPKGVAIITRPQVRGMAQGTQYQEQDLSSDDAKDIKPPYSYATMITQAILSTEEMMMSLSEIYEWIATNYSFYRHSKSGWQNSIRHNLSLNKAFEKVPRKANEPGKGKKWQITPQFKEEFIRKANMGKLAKGSNSKRNANNNQHQHQQVLHLSQPSSAPPQQQHHQLPPPQQQQQQQQHMYQQQQQPQQAFHAPPPPPPAPVQPPLPPPPIQYSDDHDQQNHQGPHPTLAGSTSSNATIADFQTPQKQQQQQPQSFQNASGYADQYNYLQFSNGPLPTMTPSPSRRYPVSQLEAYTPDRGSQVNSNNNDNDGHQNHNTNSNPNANITTNGPHTNGNSTKKVSAFGSLVNNTPAPQAQHLQLAPPSSAQQQQLPSSFMPASSPAPFWKYMQLSSTPIRNNDLSPTKFSSPPVGADPTPKKADQSHQTTTPANEKVSSERGDSLGDLQDVDLTRGFGHIGKWRESDVSK